MDPVLRNDVPRKAAGAAGVDVAGEPRLRIADEPQHASVVDRPREVAVAFQRRRHGAVHEEGIGPRQVVERVEEEQPVAFLVELGARDQYWSAQRERRVVIPVARLLAERRRSAGRVARAPTGPVVRVEPFVALEERGRPAEPGATALGHDDDVGTAGAAVFGLVVRRLNLHFRDGVERGGHVVGCAESRVLAGDAVVRHPHELVAEPVDFRTEEGIPAGRVAHVRVDDPGHALQQSQEVAAAQLRVLDLVGPDRARPFAALRLRAQRRGLDGHDLLEAADSRMMGGTATRSVAVNTIPFCLVDSEPGQRDPQVIRAGEKVREHEQPLAVRDGITFHGGRGVAHRDRGAWNGAIAGVDDRATNLAGQSLGIRTAGGAAHQTQRQESEHSPRYETFHVSSSRNHISPVST